MKSLQTYATRETSGLATSSRSYKDIDGPPLRGRPPCPGRLSPPPSVARLSGAVRLTRGFASPPRGGFALVGKGSSLAGEMLVEEGHGINKYPSRRATARARHTRVKGRVGGPRPSQEDLGVGRDLRSGGHRTPPGGLRRPPTAGRPDPWLSQAPVTLSGPSRGARRPRLGR